MATFKRGDRVRWKYGGPEMVVGEDPKQSYAGMIPTVLCLWFSRDDHFHKEAFPVDELTLVSPPATP